MRPLWFCPTQTESFVIFVLIYLLFIYRYTFNYAFFTRTSSHQTEKTTGTRTVVSRIFILYFWFGYCKPSIYRASIYRVFDLPCIRFTVYSIYRAQFSFPRFATLISKLMIIKIRYTCNSIYRAYFLSPETHGKSRVFCTMYMIIKKINVYI